MVYAVSIQKNRFSFMILLATNTLGTRLYAFQVSNDVSQNVVIDSIYRIIVQTNGTLTIYYYGYDYATHSVNVPYTLGQNLNTSTATQWSDCGTLVSTLGLYNVQWLDDAHFEIYTSTQVRNLFVCHTSGSMRFESITHQDVEVVTQEVVVQTSTLPSNLETNINKLGGLTWVFYSTLALCCLIFLFRKRGC